MIRDSLISWKTTTEMLITILDVHDEDKRDTVIVQVDRLLDERETLKSTIQAPFTDAELAFGQELLPLEKIMTKKLEHFTQTIRFDITDQQKKKVSLHAYMDPYNQVFRDGTFYDKKK
ncbi:hypothetical protein [Psychrobacillus antarcticus]|uniref:hypothetical protein n=1 Tax=Psychrobacillus antarcticus TaxID=2879115 RepID=UPI0024083BBE|nr:hypothetical protein [Psychrobacillus antarcticus]